MHCLPNHRGPFVVLVAVIWASACGVDATGGSEVGQDVSSDLVGPDMDGTDTVEPDVVELTCGSDDPSVGNLSWATEVTDGCTHYRASVHLPDALDAAAFEPLSGLYQVAGSVTVFRPHVIVDFGLLTHLEVIVGEFSYRLDDTSRPALSGPPRLREVGELRVESNHALEDLGGFVPDLQVVHGDLKIKGNPKLSSAQIDAFLERVEVRGEVVVENNGTALR